MQPKHTIYPLSPIVRSPVLLLYAREMQAGLLRQDLVI